MIDWGEKLEEKIRTLPDSPGCYLMKDREGTIIYVGKAVNLKNRVRSYFRDTSHTPKVAAMISRIFFSVSSLTAYIRSPSGDIARPSSERFPRACSRKTAGTGASNRASGAEPI